MKKSAGAPTKYRTAFSGHSYAFCALGATDKGLAILFDVSRDTIYEWKKQHPLFAESIKAARCIRQLDQAKAKFVKK